jgi:hypothetical protein
MTLFRQTLQKSFPVRHNITIDDIRNCSGRSDIQATVRHRVVPVGDNLFEGNLSET